MNQTIDIVSLGHLTLGQMQISLRSLDLMGAGVAAAYVDLAIQSLRADLGSSETEVILDIFRQVDFSILDEMAGKIYQ